MTKISSRVCELCNPRDYKAMRALESLTPNGSEFVNEPDRCVAFVKDRLDFTVYLVKQRNQAQQALRQILEFAHPTIDKEIIAIAKEALR